MPPFIVVELILGAVILSVALLHLALGLRGVRRPLNLSFACLGVLVACEALSAPQRYLSQSIPEVVLGIKLSQGAIVAWAGALVWFVREFVGLRSRRIPIFITGVAALVLTLHLTLPYSIRFESITGLRTATLPGGGTMYVPQGPLHPLLWLGHLLGISTILYLVGACIALWHREGKKARRLPSLRGLLLWF